MLNNTITVIIIGSILALFFLSITSKSDRSFKNEIVSLGVLGTFIGIALGLYHFDVSNIKESMPYLLGGLKTAFITSGVGILFSIILSIIKPPKKQTRSEALDALEMIVEDFNKNLTKQFGDNFKELNDAVKHMVLWQENYKNQLQRTEQSVLVVVDKLGKISLQKEHEQKNIQAVINNLVKSSNQVQNSLEQSTSIVKENMQLLLREANGRL